jgi:hypothetical protein
MTVKKIFDRIALAAELAPGVLLIIGGLALAVGNRALWL